MYRDICDALYPLTHSVLFRSISSICRPTGRVQTELTDANRKADQRANSARQLQLELEKLRPRVCRLVGSLAGISVKSFGCAEDTEWGSADPFWSGGGDRWGRGGGSLGYGGYGGGGVCRSRPKTLSEVLRRLAEGRMSQDMSAAQGQGGGGEFEPSVAAAAAAAAPYPYAFYTQDLPDDPFAGARDVGIGGAAIRALGRSRKASASTATGGSNGAGAPDASQDILRASLDELCNLHDEPGAIGRMDPSVDSNISRVMSIQIRRAEIEAAEARGSGPEAVRAATQLPRDRVTARRMRLGDSYIPPRTRRVVAAPAPMPSAEEDEAEDGTDFSAPSPSGAPAAAATQPPAVPLGTTRAARNPYAKGANYAPRPPRRPLQLGDDESGMSANSRSGGSGAAATNARWERQPATEYIPIARRRQLAAEELARQQSVSAPRSTRTVVAAAAAAAAAVATSAPSSGLSGDGASATRTSAAAPAPAAALFFPPSTHPRGGAAGAGQPPPMPSAEFRFGRTSSTSLTQAAGLPPVFPSASSCASASSNGPSGTMGAVRRTRTINRRDSKAEDGERFGGGSGGADCGDSSDPFYSSLPPLPPAPQYRGRGASGTAGTASGARSSGESGAAANDRGVGGAGVEPAPSHDPDHSSVNQGQPLSDVPPESAELLDLYNGRCQEAHVRLRTAVSEREALAASTVPYLRSGRRAGAGRGFATVSGGSGTSGVMAAGMPVRAMVRRGSTAWGGDGGQSGVRGTEKGYACCHKCTEEVRIFCGKWLDQAS